MLEYLVLQHIDVNALNIDNETALHMAIMMKAYGSALALLHLGADPNVVAKNGNAPLHYLPPGCSEDESFVLMNGIMDSCRSLVDAFKEAGCDFSIENADKHSVLQVILSKKANETVPSMELWFVCFMKQRTADRSFLRL